MSPQLLSPDVFIQEVQGQSGQIPTPSTSTMAMAGYSTRGPENKALIVGSFKEYTDNFGSFSKKSRNTYAAAAFFQNGGSRMVFVRTLHSDATFASGAFPAGVSGTWNATASGRGQWANGAEITISGNPNFYDQATATYSAFDVAVETIDPTTDLLALVETFEAVDLVDPTDPNYVVSVLGESSNNLVLTPSNAPNAAGIPGPLNPTSHSGVPIGTGDGVTTAFAANLSSYVSIGPTTLAVKVSGTTVAVDDGQGNLIAVSGGPAIGGTIDYSGGALSITITPAPSLGSPITANLITAPAQSVTITLLGGSDGSHVTAADVVGLNLEPLQKGLYALDTITDQLQICLPDYAGDATTDLALISYCSNRADALAIIQTPQGQTAQQAVNYRRNIMKSVSSYGCIYWPWIRVPDPLNNNRPLAIPPCGHAAGRMAFTDQNDNVGKAPAGVNRGQLNFIIDLEKQVTKTDRDTVYQAQINPIRSDSSVGNALWGNKTLQITGDFTDINVRRLFIFLEKAQYTGLLDILFENVGPVTFGVIKARLDAFLEGLWLAGVIGSGVLDKSQAFKVICDNTNNPPATQQQHIINVDEFIKPNIDAEFIVLKLQKVFDASQV